MAKAKNNRREPTYDGLTREQLIRALELDGLTREACFAELFGEFFDDDPRPRGPGQVSQAGPARREPNTHEE